jgi:hypothetical protein
VPAHLSRSRQLLALLLLAVLGATSLVRADPAGAQQPPAGSEVNSFALSPTGDDPDQPSTRPALTIDAAPGATVNDSVSLWNYGNTQLTFSIYPTDAFNNADGAFDVLAGSEQPKDVGTWISLPYANVTVPGGKKLDIPISLTVPANASPGDHSGAILISSAVPGTSADGKPITLDRRTGTRVYIRVAGPLEPHLTVTKAHSTYHGSLDPRKGSLSVTWVVRNVGNVRLGAEQQLEVENVLGRKVHSADAKPIVELLPGNEVTFTQSFDDVPATVRVKASIKVTPSAAGEGAGDVATTSRTAGTWALPWLLLGLALVITGAARGIRWLRSRGAPGGPPSRPPTADDRDRVLVP